MIGPEDNYRVPRSRASQTHRSMRAEILAAIEPILFESARKGEEIRRRLEEDFAAAMQARFACGVHSGTLGLLLALRACDVQPGDEVITVGNSDVSTTAAISHCGAISVLCDVRASDYTMDPGLVEALITPRTTVLLPVDLYGHPTDVKALREIADRRGLRIVEDATLATGAFDKGLPVGAYADVAVFSFAPFKPLGSSANGGMLTTSDEKMAERIRLLCSYGHALDGGGELPGHQRHIDEGYNMPLDPLQAALVSVKLPHLAEWTARRRAIARAYADGLRGTGVRLPVFRPESAPTFRSYTVCVRERQRIYQGLRDAGVEVALHYVPPVYRQPVYDGRGKLRNADCLPVTDQLGEELLCLPVTVELEQEEVEYAVQALRSLL